MVRTGDAPVVVTGIKSFGTGITDDRLRGGASGGLVLDTQGRLVGLSNYETTAPPDSSLSSKLTDWLDHKYSPLDVPQAGKQNVTITPVNNQMLVNLKHELAQQPTRQDYNC